PPVATTGGGPPPVGPGAISQIRPGYEVAPSRIAFVQNLGSSWPLIGWALTGIAAVITGFQVIQVGNMFTLIFSGAGPAQNQALSNPILSLIGLLVGLSTIAYAILDLLDRRGNWWWIAAVLCCGAFPGLGVYMLLGRREISNL
ncbi:MAG: hypothetical protein HY248_05485, partial [Fimbriimonas ginsengisoli]|nr:hypothetical protein [Fimbriimonas ginsengisoli]